MNFIYYVYAILHCYLVGTYSADETDFANVIGTLELISRRTLNIEEKVNGYGNFKHEMDHADENKNGYEELKLELDNANEKLDMLVKSVGRLESVYDCGWPELSHGHYEGKSTFYLDVLLAVCDEGYTRSGYEEITCKVDRKWSSLPMCKPDCQSPRVLNSLEYGTNDTYPYGHRIKINCKKDYRRQGGHYLRCDGERGWVGDNIQCHLVDCGQPPVDDCGTYGDGYNTTINSTLSLTCNEGSLKFGPEFIRCEADGRWKGRQMCLERTCIDYTMENGTNSTECLLKNSNARLVASTGIQRMGYGFVDNKTVCLHFCLERHSAFSYINFKWGICTCVRAVETYNGYVLRNEQNFHVFFREANKSTYLGNII